MFSSETLRISMAVQPYRRPTVVDEFARLSGRVFRDVLQLAEIGMGLGDNISSDKCEWESGPKWFPPPPPIPLTVQRSYYSYGTLDFVQNFVFPKTTIYRVIFDSITNGHYSKGSRLHAQRAGLVFVRPNDRRISIFAPLESVEFHKCKARVH